MKRIKRLLSVVLMCCMLTPVTATAVAIPLEGYAAQSSFTQSELEGISSSLNVPESLDVEITQSDPYYWEAGERWLVQVTVTYQGITVAGAAVDASTGELIRNILTYSAPSAAFRFYLDTASNCLANGSSAEMYAGLFVNNVLYHDASEGSYTISVSDSSVVRITQDGWSDTLGQHYLLEALQPGSVSVTITDPRAGVSGTLELHVVDAELVYTFDTVPEMTIEDGKTTKHARI